MAVDSIHVLYVDDDDSFRDVVSTALDQISEQVTVTTTGDPTEVTTRLEHDSVDCILSDHEMPELSGIELLKQVRTSFPNLPFILYTGRGSEEVASEAISAGVTDYLQKQGGSEHFELLSNRIQNVVSQHRAERRATQAEHRYEALFEYTNDAVAFVEFDGEAPRIEDANDSFCELFVNDGADIQGCHIDQLVVPSDDQDQAPELSRRVRNGDPVVGHQVTRMTTDGPREFLLQAVPVNGGGDHTPTEAFAVYTDITEQRETQQRFREMLQETRRLMNTTSKQETAELAVRIADHVLNTEISTIHVFSEDNDQLVPLAVTDTVADTFEQPPVYDRSGDPGSTDAVVWKTVETDEPVVINDISSSSVLSSPTPVDCGAVYPLEGHGVLIASATEPRSLTDTDTALLELLTATVVAAFERVEREVQLQQREEELVTERDRFQTLFSQFNQPAVEVELKEDPSVTAVNPAFEQHFGFPADEIEGEVLDEYIAPPDCEAEARKLNEQARNGTAYEGVEVERMTSDGRRTFLLQNALHDDRPAGFAIYTDITEHKRRERILRELHAVATDIPDCDTTEEICERTVEAAESVCEFDNCIVFLAEEEQLSVYATSADLLMNDFTGFEMEGNVAARTYTSGESFVVQNTSTHPIAYDDHPYRSGVSVPIGTHGVCEVLSTDVAAFNDNDREFLELLASYTRQALDELQSTSEAERQMERIDRFTSIISHDLRTPIQLISGQLELARQTGDPEYFEACHDALTQAESLIDETLKLARHGTVVENPSPTDIETIARQAWGFISTSEATLNVRTDQTVYANDARLTQLLQNLFQNAIEHGGNGITVTVDDLGSKNGFSVIDNGDGLATTDKSELFDPNFSTAGDEMEHGFGLVIVDEIVRAHDWRISVTHSDQGGARFEIYNIKEVDQKGVISGDITNES